ncbi:MAG: hypothetical protein LIO99_08635 [Clostridiales bacterium]|nr:hypothetical protein [Clostridiales bacterium]
MQSGYDEQGRETPEMKELNRSAAEEIRKMQSQEPEKQQTESRIHPPEKQQTESSIQPLEKQQTESSIHPPEKQQTESRVQPHRKIRTAKSVKEEKAAEIDEDLGGQTVLKDGSISLFTP